MSIYNRRRLAAIIIIILLVLIVLIGYYRPALQARGKPYHHLNNGYFRNPEDNDSGRPKLYHLMMFMTHYLFTANHQVDIPKDHVLPEKVALERYNRNKNSDSITWLGHASFLINLDGKTILTDPYLTEVAGPLGFGPKRIVPPGISIANLPKINMILITHNHYDSLDVNTIRQIKNRKKIIAVVPLGMTNYFYQAGYQHIHQLDWYQSLQFDHIRVKAIPAIHFSSRGLFDRNKQLWAGYIIKSKHHKILFMCDSAYGNLYKAIGKEYGPFDAIIIGIGAYEPQNVMRYSHTTPEQAAQIAKDVRADIVVAMHWGTVVLSDEPPFEPPVRFKKAALKAGYANNKIWVLKIGESRKIPRA